MNKKVVWITGASSGIGKSVAKAAGKGLVKTVKRFGTAQGRADAALKKQQKTIFNDKIYLLSSKNVEKTRKTDDPF